uniref:probable E3 ubiquitin-protein ligase ZFP1 n=1 Tax=Erigeron canadensis TaxID=72917 RepID=UPI001CB9641E|nr:probable E3 ubiquitin-protein ligase ZFP1 [Erigeron canadensis]
MDLLRELRDNLIIRQNTLLRLLECLQQLIENRRALQDLRAQLANIISGSAGLSENQISKHLKVSTIQERKMVISSRGGKEEELVLDTLICAICLGEYEENGETTIGTLDCGHEYHPQSIKDWLLCKNVCPMCRATALNVDVNLES